MPKKLWLGLVPIAGLFLYQFFQFNVLQDDAFISFRYIRNFLNGHGLVFNIGERVEGYTNFLWIILLSLLTKLGLPLIETARVLGIVAGIGTIALSAYAAHKLYPKRNWLWVLSVPLLLAANGAFAYWAGSGLETGLFTLLATAAAITYLTNTPLSLLLVTLAALTRPEGALLAFLFGIAGVILKQKSWKATLVYLGALAALMLPYAVFKWLYFGSLLPNPFYAKTGISREYLSSGLEYVFLFLKHYALFGIALIPAVIHWKKMADLSRFSLLVFGGFTFYVVAVGGDVLEAHRFFVPLLPFFYFPIVDSFYQLLEKGSKLRLFFPSFAALFAFYTYQAPSSYLKKTAYRQGGATQKMLLIGQALAKEKAIKSFAVSALGALSYCVGERKVIDMLGLVDPVVAKSPKKIEGLESTWRERNYNAGYILSRKPDVILFSTELKPSSLGERALFLYSDFRQNYRLEFLYEQGRPFMFYRRFRDRPARSGPDRPARFANLINEGFNQVGVDNPRGISLLREVLANGGTDCSALYLTLGYLYFKSHIPESTEVYVKKGMEMDSDGPVSRFYYRNHLFSQKRYAEAAEQDSLMRQMVPEAAEYLQQIWRTRR